MDLNTFPLFSNLPTELRIKIWALNLPGPRIVSLRYTSAMADPASLLQEKLPGCTSSAPIPANLHVSREARAHALRHYQLSFNLPHCAPKIWFDVNKDVLYFPSKAGWLGSWSHFVNAFSLITPVQLGRLKRLAVYESLFRGVKGENSSPNVQANCVKEFWEYVSRKCGNLEEVVILVEGNATRTTKEEEMRTWMEEVLGCIVGPEGGIWIGSPQERLMESLESGLRFVEAESGWKAPRWDVLPAPKHGIGGGTSRWPTEPLGRRPQTSRGRARSQEVLDSIVIPYPKDMVELVEEEQSFWMGGQLPHWHYLAEAR